MAEQWTFGTNMDVSSQMESSMLRESIKSLPREEPNAQSDLAELTHEDTEVTDAVTNGATQYHSRIGHDTEYHSDLRPEAEGRPLALESHPEEKSLECVSEELAPSVCVSGDLASSFQSDTQSPRSRAIERSKSLEYGTDSSKMAHTERFASCRKVDEESSIASQKVSIKYHEEVLTRSINHEEVESIESRFRALAKSVTLRDNALAEGGITYHDEVVVQSIALIDDCEVGSIEHLLEESVGHANGHTSWDTLSGESGYAEHKLETGLSGTSGHVTEHIMDVKEATTMGYFSGGSEQVIEHLIGESTMGTFGSEVIKHIMDPVVPSQSKGSKRGKDASDDILYGTWAESMETLELDNEQLSSTGGQTCGSGTQLSAGMKTLPLGQLSGMETELETQPTGSTLRCRKFITTVSDEDAQEAARLRVVRAKLIREQRTYVEWLKAVSYTIACVLLVHGFSLFGDKDIVVTVFDATKSLIGFFGIIALSLASSSKSAVKMYVVAFWVVSVTFVCYGGVHAGISYMHDKCVSCTAVYALALIAHTVFAVLGIEWTSEYVRRSIAYQTALDEQAMKKTKSI